ncbi:MAG: hypothetical protein J7501_05615 [Bdellovibrio sp.]|nr:hypothetical protein [Bdellovibrio sp.]
MLKKPSEIHFIAVTFVLVVLLGARTFASLTEPDQVASVVVPAVASKASVSVSSRQPASIPSSEVVPGKVETSLHQSADFDLDCTKKSATKLDIKAGYVQFRGKSCVRGFSVSEIEIVNKSNGYTASVFDRGSDKYQTDLIQLKHGDNEIAVRYRSAGKTVEEIIRVTAPKI